MKFCLGAILILDQVSSRAIPLEAGPSNGETDPQWNSSWADRFWVPEVTVSPTDSHLSYISSAVAVYGMMIMVIVLVGNVKIEIESRLKL